MTISPGFSVGARKLLDPGAEPFAVYWAIEHAGRVNPAVPQPRQEGLLPVAIRA
jgi:hypothetical protein